MKTGSICTQTTAYGHASSSSRIEVSPLYAVSLRLKMRQRAERAGNVTRVTFMPFPGSRLAVARVQCGNCQGLQFSVHCAHPPSPRSSTHLHDHRRPKRVLSLYQRDQLRWLYPFAVLFVYRCRPLAAREPPAFSHLHSLQHPTFLPNKLPLKAFYHHVRLL